MLTLFRGGLFVFAILGVSAILLCFAIFLGHFCAILFGNKAEIKSQYSLHAYGTNIVSRKKMTSDGGCCWTSHIGCSTIPHHHTTPRNATVHGIRLAQWPIPCRPVRRPLAGDARRSDGVHLGQGGGLGLRHAERLLLGHGPGQAPARAGPCG